MISVVCMLNPEFAGRRGLGPSRIVWFSAPATFCQARSGNVFMSSLRTTRSTLYAEEVMRRLGVPIVDGRSITTSRWDASYDGLHYAMTSGGSDAWYSQVSSQVFQAVLNTIFPTCNGKNLK